MVRGHDDYSVCEMNHIKMKIDTHSHISTKREPDNVEAHRVENVISETYDREKISTIANAERIFMPTDCKLYVLYVFFLYFPFSTHSLHIPTVSNSEFYRHSSFAHYLVSNSVPPSHRQVFDSILLRLEFIHA